MGSSKYQFISTTSHHITTNVKTQRPQDSYCENSLRDLLRKHIRGWFYDPILHQSPLSPVDFSPGNCVWPTHITLSLGNQPLLSPTTPTLRVHWLGIIGGHPLLLYLSLPDPSSPTVFSVLVKTTCRFPNDYIMKWLEQIVAVCTHPSDPLQFSLPTNSRTPSHTRLGELEYRFPREVDFSSPPSPVNMAARASGIDTEYWPLEWLKPIHR